MQGRAAVLGGLALLALFGLLLVLSRGWRAQSPAEPPGPWTETRFRTGCDPGPFNPPREPHPAAPLPEGGLDPPEVVPLHVNLAQGGGRPMLGAGFNFEHALWSCRTFRPLLRPEILDPFRPAIARVDTGLLPAAPPELPASALSPAVYRSVLASEPYRDSWRFLRELNRAGVKIALGVWGGPEQFTVDGTRLGQLKPEHYDDYANYVATVVDFIVREQQAPVWAVTIANEPDGGDGNRIPPAGLLAIARRLAPRLSELGVKLYGPDTGSPSEVLDYLPALLDDPTVSKALAFVGFHAYSANPEVGDVVRYVRQRRPDLPVVITEYTSFRFGDLDDGQEASDDLGFMVDVLNTLLSHYRHGAEAALYWDAVDYLQPGHDAITRWGLLRGPTDNFERRRRYYGFQQVLPYLQPGAVVLDARQEGGDDVSSLAVRTADGGLAVFLVNLGASPIELFLAFEGADAPPSLVVMRTDSSADADRLDPVHLQDGRGRVSLPGRSVTTLLSPDPAPAPVPAN